MVEKTSKIPCGDLEISPADSDSPIPLYYQVEIDLRRAINSGELTPGSVLPSEPELSECYGVARHTLRKALSRLSADGLIARHAGRGTFVREPVDRREFLLNRSFTRQMAEMGKRAHSEVMEQSKGIIDKNSPQLFHKYLGAECLYLARLRFGDGEPIGLQYTTVITELCPDLETYDFSQNSLYDILAREYNLVVTEISHTVNAVAADDFLAESLQVSESAPLLFVKTAAFLDNHRIIEYTESYYRADRYEYKITQSLPE